MPVKPAEAMAESLEGRGSLGEPMETVAKEMGMVVRVEGSSGIVGVVVVVCRRNLRTEGGRAKGGAKV